MNIFVHKYTHRMGCGIFYYVITRQISRHLDIIYVHFTMSTFTTGRTISYISHGMCTLYSVRLTLYRDIIQCIVYNVRWILYILHFALYTVCRILHCMECSSIVYCNCTLYNIHCTIYTVHYTMYNMHCTIYIVQYTIYTVYWFKLHIHYSVYIINIHNYLLQLFIVKCTRVI